LRFENTLKKLYKNQKMNKKIIILLFCISFGLKLQGQKTLNLIEARKEVKSMFDNDVKNLWINVLSGKLDNIHLVDMVIGTDGNICKGLYTFRSSGITFYFEGEDIDDHLKLIEYNKKGKHTGYILGNYDGKKFETRWLDPKKELFYSLNLDFVNLPEDYTPIECDHRIWYSCYEGKIDNSNWKINVYREGDIFKIFQHIDQSKTFEIITCPFPNCESVTYTFKNGKWKLFLNNEPNELVIQQLKGEEEGAFYSLKNVNTARFDCYEYADYTTRLEIVKPVIKNNKFNEWMDSQLKQWRSESEKHIFYQTAEESSYSERWQKLGYAWVELDIMTTNVISGTIYMQSSWNKKTEKVSFIFDLKTSKIVDPKDLFEKNLDFTEYFSKVITAKKKELGIKDPTLNKWVQTQPFDFVTLKDKAFSFKTRFSSIYGEQEILVPYSELKEFLKPRTFLTDLVGQ